MEYTPKDGFPYYVNLVKDEHSGQLFTSLTTNALLDTIDEEKAGYRYAPNKWSIKQVVGHITDHERIKMFRAFLLSRKDSVQLWGYDQNLLVDHSRFEELSWTSLKEDYKNVRKASLSFIEALSEDQLKIKGLAQQHEVTLEDFLRSIIGHEIHHINIVKDRYLQ